LGGKGVTEDKRKAGTGAKGGVGGTPVQKAPT